MKMYRMFHSSYWLALLIRCCGWRCPFIRKREDLCEPLYRKVPKNIPYCVSVYFYLWNINTGFRRTDVSDQCHKNALKMEINGVGSRAPYWQQPLRKSEFESSLKRFSARVFSSLSHSHLGFLPSSQDLLHKRFTELQKNGRVRKATVVTKLL